MGLPRVLFVCLGNACRSPMAEAFARKLGEGVLEADSAGLTPASGPSRGALEAMAGKGYDISGHRPKLMDPAWALTFDRVVLMGDDVADLCPAEVGKVAENWGIVDPFGGPPGGYPPARDLIEERVRSLVDSLREPPAAGREDGR